MTAQVIFFRTPHNLNSIMALLGAIENYPGLDDIAVEVWEKIPEAYEFTQGPVFFCVSFTTVALFDTREIFAQFRRLIKDRVHHIIAGGPHVTGMPMDLERLGIDYGVIGEGEHTFPTLLEHLLSGKAPHALDGLAFSSPDGVQVNPPRNPINLDEYFPYSSHFRWFAPIEITRGCAWGCKFCQTGSMHSVMRHRSIPAIKKCVEFLISQRYPQMRFLAPDAFRYGARTGRELRPKKIQTLLDATWNVKGVEKVFLGSFPSEVRPDSVTREILEVVAPRVSNGKISVGLQTADDKILKSSGRGHTLTDFWNAIDLLQEFEFTPIVDMIFGLPGETEETVQANLRTIRALVSRNLHVRGHTFLPLTGTRYQEAAPGKVDRRIRDLLNKQTSTVVQGDWREQEELAQKLHDWIHHIGG